MVCETARLRPALLLTGGPAVGKSATALALAQGLERCAVLEVDDVRHLVKSGSAAPWEGEEGLRQQELGVRNASSLAVSFLRSSFCVVLTDVVTQRTEALYRSLIDGVLVVALVVSRGEARRRASLRRMYLTPIEFERLHDAQAVDPPAVDHRLDVSELTFEQQVAQVRAIWSSAGGRHQVRG